MRYHPPTGKFYLHWDGEDKSDYDVNQKNYPDELEDLVVADTDADKGYVTVGLFKDHKPQGLTWQWKSERMLEGFLYGEVDEEGRFTGEEITYIYPDLLTGLHGKFLNGEVVEARAVDIVAERCDQGVKQIKMKLNTRDSTVWRVEHSTPHQIVTYTDTLGQWQVTLLIYRVQCTLLRSLQP